MEKQEFTTNAGQDLLQRIDVPSILRDLLSMKLFILLAAIGIGCLFGAAYDKIYPETYSVSTVVSVSSINGEELTASEFVDDYDYTASNYNVSSTEKSMNIFMDMLQGSMMRRRVWEVIGQQDYSVSINRIAATNIITITVTAATPKTALEALNTLLDVYPQLTGLIIGRMRLSTLQVPVVAGKTNCWPQRLMFALIGFLIGALLYCAAIAVFSFFRYTVKNEKDVHRYVDTHLLGTLRVLRRTSELADSNFLISDPRMNGRLVEDYYQLASRISSKLTKHDSKALMVTSSVPSEGKTTTSINLSIALSLGQKKVLLIDADFRNPSIGKALGLEKPADGEYMKLSNALENQGVIREDDLYRIPGSGVYVLCNLQEVSHASKYMEDGSLKNLMKLAKQEYDYIIMDSGPMCLVSDSENQSSVCDEVLLVIMQDMVPIPVINDIVDILNKDRSSLMGCVLRVPATAASQILSGLFKKGSH